MKRSTLNAAVAKAARPFMTTKEVSDYTGIPEGSLRNYRLRGAGGPPSFCLTPGRVVYRRDLLEAWIAERERETGVGTIPEPRTPTPSTHRRTA